MPFLVSESLGFWLLKFARIAYSANTMKLPVEQVKQIDNAEAGRKIRELRTGSNITLRCLAAAMKISPPFLSDMELGRRGWSPKRFELAQQKIKEIAK